MFLIIGIFNGCEVRTANSVTRVTVWHREACRVMLNSYPEWRHFQFAPNNHYGFFFLHTLPSTIAFRFEYVLVYQFYAEITTFVSIKKCLFGSYLRCWRWNDWQWRQHDVKTCKMTSKRHNRRPVFMHKSRLTLPRVRRHFQVPVGFMEIPVG